MSMMLLKVLFNSASSVFKLLTLYHGVLKFLCSTSVLNIFISSFGNHNLTNVLEHLNELKFHRYDMERGDVLLYCMPSLS